MGIIIKNSVNIKIEDIELVSFSILVAGLTIHNLNYKIIVAYAPYECLSSSTKEKLYNKL